MYLRNEIFYLLFVLCSPWFYVYRIIISFTEMKLFIINL